MHVIYVCIIKKAIALVQYQNDYGMANHGHPPDKSDTVKQHLFPFLKQLNCQYFNIASNLTIQTFLIHIMNKASYTNAYV